MRICCVLYLAGIDAAAKPPDSCMAMHTRAQAFRTLTPITEDLPAQCLFHRGSAGTVPRWKGGLSGLASSTRSPGQCVPGQRILRQNFLLPSIFSTFITTGLNVQLLVVLEAGFWDTLPLLKHP